MLTILKSLNVCVSSAAEGSQTETLQIYMMSKNIIHVRSNEPLQHCAYALLSVYTYFVTERK